MPSFLRATLTACSACPPPPQARDHARQLLEKHTGKPFFDNANYSAGQARMTRDEVAEGLDWLADRFFIIRYEDEALPSVEWVLEIARVAVLRCVEAFCDEEGCSLCCGLVRTRPQAVQCDGMRCCAQSAHSCAHA